MSDIYIAGFFDTRARLLPYRDRLKKAGHCILSTWLEEENVTYQGTSEAYHKACAERDLHQVEHADLFILDTLDETPRGGREVELGLALARRIPVYLVGPVRNVFHQLVQRKFDDWPSCLAALE